MFGWAMPSGPAEAALDAARTTRAPQSALEILDLKRMRISVPRVAPEKSRLRKKSKPLAPANRRRG